MYAIRSYYVAYLLWFGIVALIFALMHYFTELSGRQKGVISLLAALAVTGAIAYNISSEKERAQITEIELSYNFV